MQNRLRWDGRSKRDRQTDSWEMLRLCGEPGVAVARKPNSSASPAPSPAFLSFFFCFVFSSFLFLIITFF